MPPPALILVLDDEPVIMQTLVLIFNRFSGEFTAFGLAQGAEVLALARGIRLDLVLADVHLRGAPGLGHALALRNLHGCRVLLMSGDAATADLLDELHRQGRDGFAIVAKPVHPAALVERIRHALV